MVDDGGLPGIPFGEDLVGRRFGPDGGLLIERLLGSGGMGAVYRAFSKERSAHVAVKFLRPDRFHDREVMHRFKTEGRKFARVKHPNVVRIHALRREQGLLFIESEFIDGKNVFELLERDGPFAPERALEVCRDVAAGLHAAHEQKLIHRDLKPENIMIGNEDGVVKVIDFGIAKDLDASIQITQMGNYIGTPSYSAPEQIKGEEIDLRADIFSMGVILYEMLTGKVAFDGRHTVDVFKATIKDRPIPPHRLNDGVVRPVANLIDHMIEKRPSKRPQDMMAVCEIIDQVLVRLREGYSAEERKGIVSRLKGLFMPGSAEEGR